MHVEIVCSTISFFNILEFDREKSTFQWNESKITSLIVFLKFF